MEVVEKVWGNERIFVNEPEYCFKKLFLLPGRQSSLHYHKKKKETFVIEFGSCSLEIHKRDDVKKLALTVGGTVTITPGTPHRFFEAGEDGCVIEEISTHHDEDDVVRLEKSK